MKDKICGDPIECIRSNCNTRKRTKFYGKQKLWSARLINENRWDHIFVSARGHTFFRRRCDLINALNHAFGCRYQEEWQKMFGDKVIIEEREFF